MARKVYGVLVRAIGVKPGAKPIDRNAGEHGNCPGSALPPGGRSGAGRSHRRLTGLGRDGAAVVVVEGDVSIVASGKAGYRAKGGSGLTGRGCHAGRVTGEYR